MIRRLLDKLCRLFRRRAAFSRRRRAGGEPMSEPLVRATTMAAVSSARRPLSSSAVLSARVARLARATLRALDRRPLLPRRDSC
jgi:hypothetical protein